MVRPSSSFWSLSAAGSCTEEDASTRAVRNGQLCEILRETGFVAPPILSPPIHPIPPRCCQAMNSTLPYPPFTILPPTSTPWYHSSSPDLIPGVPDKVLALLCPVISYWCLSIFFHLLDSYSERPPFSWMGVEKYRMHESDEMKARNKVTPTEVLRAVFLQQVFQTALGYWWLDGENPGDAVALSTEDSTLR